MTILPFEYVEFNDLKYVDVGYVFNFQGKIDIK